MWGGGTGEYRELISPLREHLRESGYSIRYKKSGFTHDLVVEDNDDSLLIQHQRRSKGNFEKNRRGLEREVANHRIISKEDLTYAVLSPEDIILHKLSRAMLFADKYGVALPRDMPLKDFKTSIDAIRANVLARGDNVDPQEVARLRVFYDLYDIRCIANNVGLNANYFDESLVDWLKNDFKGLDFRKTLDRLGIALS